MGLQVDVGFRCTENLSNKTMQDQKRFPAKKESEDRATFSFFTDQVTQSVKGGIKLCKWAFR